MRRYVILGTGGTGGAIGAYLAKAGMDVVFIARGQHLEAIREKGLRIIRPKDEFTVSPCKASTLEDYNEKADVIFVCVKGYSLDEVIPHIQRIADSNTIIIPILNIFGTGGKMQKYFPDCLVTDGCIYVAAQISGPGCIKMNGDVLRVVFGVRDKADFREELSEIEADLKKAASKVFCQMILSGMRCLSFLMCQLREHADYTIMWLPEKSRNPVRSATVLPIL